MTLAVLASGTGSILEALIDADLPIAVVVVDRHCGAEKIADHAGIPLEVVERTDFSKGFDQAAREAYTAGIVEVLERHEVDLIAMAGFGTVVGAVMHRAYPGQILNTHPALLPAFKGWHAVRDALALGVKVTGCTVHIATEAVDEGPILAEQAVSVLEGDTEESLHERIKAVERKLYPQAIREVLAKRSTTG